MQWQGKEFSLGLVSDGKRVRLRAGGTKACGLKLNWAVLEGVIEDIGLDFLRGRSPEVPHTVERCQSVGVAGPVGHLTRCLRQLDEVLDSQRRGARIGDGDKVAKVDKELNADKLDILVARVERAVDHRQEDQWVCCGGRVVDLVTPGVVEAQDLEGLEIAPAVVKIS